MKVGVLFSGGKDSTYAAWFARRKGHELSCLISIFSENKESFMFHTPSITKVKIQAEVMGVPLIVWKTKGVKEEELKDLEDVIIKAKEEFGIGGIVTGAVESVYQASRIKKICDGLNLECFNPLWHRNQEELVRDLIKDGFEAIVVGVFAYPLGKEWLGRKIDESFLEEVVELEKKYKINVAGEGGEFESFILNCPLFSQGLEVESFEDFGEKHSWRREINIKSVKLVEGSL